MNNEITKLLENLVQELGTTPKYLWNLLLKQAPLIAIVDLIQFVKVIN